LAQDEVAVVRRAKSGDREAFAELVNRYSPRVYNLVRRILRNPQDAEDALQETFLSAWQKLDSFDGHSSFFTWLYRIATNAALMKLRKDRHRREELAFEEPRFEEIERRALIDWSQDPVSDLLDLEAEQQLKKAIEELPDIYRTVFVLRDLEGLSTRDVSELLGISEANVKMRLRRARLFLREKVGAYFDKRAVK
jgi:RNA polymerase sigma-70 factor (ECF subfamily)